MQPNLDPNQEHVIGMAEMSKAEHPKADRPKTWAQIEAMAKRQGMTLHRRHWPYGERTICDGDKRPLVRVVPLTIADDDRFDSDAVVRAMFEAALEQMGGTK